MDFVKYETIKYKLYRNMKRKHVGAFRKLKKINVSGTLSIRRKKEDILKLKQLIEKYKRKIKCMEESEYGDIVVFNYNSLVKK